MENDGNLMEFVKAIFAKDAEAVTRLGGTLVSEIDARVGHWTPLHRAIETGSVMIVEAVLKLGADPNCPGGVESPLLHVVDLEIDMATQHHLSAVPDTKIIEVLLRYGADPRLGDDAGESAFSFAQKRGHHRALQLFAQPHPRGETAGTLFGRAHPPDEHAQ